MAGMKTVTAHVYGKEYTLACDLGQEKHLQALIQQVDGRTERLDAAIGRLPEGTMLLYTALMLADELHEAQKENARLQQQLAGTNAILESKGDDARLAQLEVEVAENLVDLAGRIDQLASKLAA